jgi:hypothetical protein
MYKEVMMMAKKCLLSFTCLLLVLFSLFIVSAQSFSLTGNSADIVADKDIRISLVNQEPDPVEPGQYVTVRLKVENWGNEPTAPIIVGLTPQYPFTLLDGYDAEQTVSGLERRQKADDSKILEWKLLVDKDAAEGPNNITFYYQELQGQRGIVVYKEVFDIDVRTSDTILEVVDIRTSPDNVEPGQTSTLILEIKNLADSFIKDVKVSLDLRNVDIATVGSTSEKIIQRLDGKETLIVEFDILPSSSTSLEAVKIPLNMEFKDNLNNVYTQNSTFGLILNSPVRYIVSVDDTEIMAKDQQGDVTLTVSNTGVNNIQFLTVELKESPHYSILSTEQIYIGEVESDDFETVTYKLYSKDVDSDGNMVLRLLMNFKDDYNQEYTVEEEVSVKLFTEQQMKQYGLSSSGNGGFLFMLILVVIGAVGFWYYRRRKKKQSQKDSKK